MTKLQLVGSVSAIALATALWSTDAEAGNIGLCPAIGNNPAGCSETITFGPGGAITTTPSIGPYDGSDDTSVGVINNSGASIASFNLSAGTDIFGFDGDGIDDYSADGVVGNATDAANEGCSQTSPYTGCYGGPDAYYTNIGAGNSTGTVNFLTPIPDGGEDYFSLEEAVSLSATGVGTPVTTGPGTTVPEPASLALLGSALIGLMVRRRRKGT